MKNPTDTTGIFLRSSSLNYYAKIRVWSNSLKKWQWRSMSTGTSNLSKALATRDELQHLADTAHQAGDSAITHQKATEMAIRILQWQGITSQQKPILPWLSWQKFAETWLTTTKPTVGGGTYIQYSGQLERLGEWLDLPQTPISRQSNLADFTRSHMMSFHAWLRNAGRAPKTAKNILRTVGQVFTQAIEDELITRNPVRRLKDLGPNNSRSDDPFTVDDVLAMIAHLSDPKCTTEFSSDWLTAILFGLTIGCRLGDACRRQWSEITWADETAWVGYMPEKTARHQVTVRTPIIDPLLAHLKTIRPDSPAAGDVFITPTLARIEVRHRYGLSNRFNTIMRRSGVTWRTEPPTGKAGKSWNSKGFHSFRHTLPTLMAAANIPDEVRMAVIGHTQISTHQKYTHHDDSRFRAALTTSMAPITTALDQKSSG